MKKLLTFSLLTLLCYHMLATVWVAVGVWWQDQHELSERLTVYSSVDSLVDFQVVLSGGEAKKLAEQTTEDGFTYHGEFYDVVSVELHGDTLRIAGMQDKAAHFWQQDLLSFVKKTISQPTDNASRKAGHWLKLLLKEYQPANGLTLVPVSVLWLEKTILTDAPASLCIRALRVLSPPPRK